MVSRGDARWFLAKRALSIRSNLARERAIFPPTTDNTFPATQFTVSNQSKLLCVPAERVALACVRLTNVRRWLPIT